MDLLSGLPVWAQAQPGAAGPNTIALLALRRWCGGLTLSSPRPAPGWHGLGALLAGLAALFIAAMVFQGPVVAFRQLLDVPGHIRLLVDGVRRLKRAAGLVAGLIGFVVLSWTAAESLVFFRESGRAELLALTRSRGLGELAAEQGVLAALTPLRDVIGLGDNIPLLVAAVIVLFRASIEPPRPDEMGRARDQSGWATFVWGTGALYVLYRIVARAAGSPDLPYGNCLVVETILIPVAMAMVDGLLLGWVLLLLRNSGLDAADEDRLDPMGAVALLPAATLACVAAMPARYVSAFVVLVNDHLPTSVRSTPLGAYIRWQIGDWGLADLQAAALVFAGIVGAVAWTRGRAVEAVSGYGRTLAAEGGHLVAAMAMAAAAAGTLSAVAYAVLLLLPAQPWVLNAADSYAHFATLPVGLWAMAAMLELARRSLPAATPARPVAVAGTGRGDASDPEPAAAVDPAPPLAAPAS